MQAETNSTVQNNPETLSVESMMAEACNMTGLSDWGEESFREPLGVLLDSYRKDSNLSDSGWTMIQQKLIQLLSNRLQIQDEIKHHPEILQEEIPRPLFIVSMGRTGTTLLQNLLSQDPVNRSLLYWEATAIVPPPEPSTRDSDPRIAAAENILQTIYEIAPDLAAIHTFGAKLPEECIALLVNSFISPAFKLDAKITQYDEWLKVQDMVPSYRYYRQQLQLLQSRYPTERWVLKAPLHMYSMKALMTVFPDACVVQNHRDINKVAPSSCSLLAAIRRICSDCVDEKLTGREFLDDWEGMINHGMQVRDELGSSQFFDVHYKELMQDPTGTVRRIYDYFGYPFDESFEERMREHLAGSPKDKHGAHQYSSEQFGLDPDEVNRRFAKYCERFGIIPE